MTQFRYQPKWSTRILCNPFGNVGPGGVLFRVTKMVKTIVRSKPIFTGAGAGVALLMLWAFLLSPSLPTTLRRMAILPEQEAAMPDCTSVDDHGVNRRHDPINHTFYNDPDVTYTVGSPVKNWDEKRRQWLEHHPSFAVGAENRLFMLTASQPLPCKNPIGDHLNLRLFKNKVDYCRIHGYDIFYNNALLHPEMNNYWAKIPLVRATMVAHPEVEWIFWIDSDAIFTDMDFKPPFEKYKDYNLVVDGIPNMIYEKKSWVGLNAGVFFLRNCQWSMEFLEAWAEMGPQTPNYENWAKIQMEMFPDKMYPVSDDQSAIIYLLLKEKKWGDKMYIEEQYELSGYWKMLIDSFDKINDNYARIEEKVKELQERHAEMVSEHYAEVMAEAFRKEGGIDPARPFITHFVGCGPCSPSNDECMNGMEKALNFADNQVLRNYGFVRPNLENTSSLYPLPYDFSSYKKEK